MKKYLRLFLIIVSFASILNVAQAKKTIPEDIIQAHEAVWQIVH